MGIVRSICEVSTGYGLAIFKKKWHSAKLNKIVEATMPVSPYDNHRISLPAVAARRGWVIWTSYGHRKLVMAEGKCNLGIYVMTLCFCCYIFQLQYMKEKKTPIDKTRTSHGLTDQ